MHPVRCSTLACLCLQDPQVGTLAVGAWGSVTKPITSDDVFAYARLLGDNNAVHLDDEFAKTTRFGRRIAHGMLSAGLIPTIFGAQIPGSIYVSQNLKFKRPVYVGDSVTAKVTISGVKFKPNHMVTCDTVVTTDHDGKVVIDGQAVVLLPPPPEGSDGHRQLQTELETSTQTASAHR